MMSNQTTNLTDQQTRFCDEYLVSFNAYRAAIAAGYSENTAAKGELLHTPKIQEYLKMKMNQRTERLEISHDMILREYAMIAFSNMSNYYDERGELRPMCELSERDKAAVHYLQSANIADPDGYIVGRITKIKLHNKMAALDRIAKHLGFFGAEGKKPGERIKNQEVLVEMQEARNRKQEVGYGEQEARSEKQEAAVVAEGVELEEELSGLDGELKLTADLIAVNENEGGKILTLSPLYGCGDAGGRTIALRSQVVGRQTKKAFQRELKGFCI